MSTLIIEVFGNDGFVNGEKRGKVYSKAALIKSYVNGVLYDDNYEGLNDYEIFYQDEICTDEYKNYIKREYSKLSFLTNFSKGILLRAQIELTK